MSGDNASSKPFDGGEAVKPRDSPQATTARSLGPESNGSKTSTSTSGEKRERESDNTSNISVKRRLRPSEDVEKESVYQCISKHCVPLCILIQMCLCFTATQDYDARCAELWINGEMATCEAYELLLARDDGRRQHLPREPGQVNSAFRRNNPLAQPVTQKMDGTVPLIAAAFRELIKLYHQTEASRRADFTELMNVVREVQSNFAAFSNDIRNIRLDQRKILDTLSLMSERMNVIQMYVLDAHKTITGNR